MSEHPRDAEQSPTHDEFENHRDYWKRLAAALEGSFEARVINQVLEGGPDSLLPVDAAAIQRRYRRLTRPSPAQREPGEIPESLPEAELFRLEFGGVEFVIHVRQERIPQDVYENLKLTKDLVRALVRSRSQRLIDQFGIDDERSVQYVGVVTPNIVDGIVQGYRCSSSRGDILLIETNPYRVIPEARASSTLVDYSI